MLVQISRREQRLRERLLAINEDLVNDEEHLRRRSDQRKQRLINKINRTRHRQELRLDRREASKLYRRSRLLYYLATPVYAVGRFFRSIYRRLNGRVQHHRAVTPHRSFYLTTHAQSVRQINISGYGRFVHEVGRMVWRNRRFYLKVLLLMTVVLLTIIGLNAKDSYVEMRDAIQDVDLGWFLETVGLVTQAIITSVNVGDSNKQILAIVLVIMSWLTLVYAARHIYGGNGRLKLRDALYNAGGPFVPLLMLLAIVIVQLLPLALVAIGYSAISGAGYINDGIAIENMAAWCAIALIGVLTIYWMVTSLLSLITITIPGIYPMRAYFETSVLVSGRRVKILLRLLAMLLPLVLVWLVVLIPVVLLDSHFKFTNVPLVQLATTMLVAASIIWLTTYLYMLYRRLLDSPEQPSGTPNGRFVWPWRRKQRAVALATADHAANDERHATNGYNNDNKSEVKAAAKTKRKGKK